MTQHQFEEALDAGCIELQMTTGKWYSARRNGRTKTWKTRPGWFETPVKYRLKDHARITPDDLTSGALRIKQG